jgi:hypothetical protein
MDELVREIEAFEEDPSVVKVFGAIIYSDRHPYIKKVLKDNDYWRALDEISGQRWAVFSARATEGHVEIKGGGPPGSLSMLVSVWVEPRENRKLIEYLQIDSTQKPVFVIFTRLKTGEILKSILYLDDSSLENAYKRLGQIIGDLTSAVEKIDSENIKDVETVFNAINMTAESIRDWDTVRNVFDIYQWAKKLKP